MAYESWLTEYHSGLLAEIERDCEGEITDLFPVFSRIRDPGLWNMLLWREYHGFDKIKKVLPGIPDTQTQMNWANRAGMSALGNQVQVWYDIYREQMRKHSPVELAAAKILDYGCGWGSNLRYFTKDVPSASLFGCDPHPVIIQTAAKLNKYATFAKSDSIPQRLPFDERFDLAIAMSIWTHLSEKSSETCLDALHATMRPGGLVLLTIRPPDYRFVYKGFGEPDKVLEDLRKTGFVFVGQSYEVDGEKTFGETLISMDYVRRKWSNRFDLVDVTFNCASIQQVLLTLRAR